jgi:two-component system nitrate/nitrite response regulator NarL
MTDDSVCLIAAKRLSREGLRRILLDSSFTVIHEASSIEDALPFIESLQPSLVLVDLPEGGEIPTEHMSQILAAAPRVRIVVLTGTIVGHRLADALSAGVHGYLPNSISPEALHQSLRLVLLGEKVFPTDLADLLIRGQTMSRSDNGPLGNFNDLSDREMEILRCLLNGAQNKQIACELDISDGTVKVYLKAIMRKIRVQNRTQAAIWALQHSAALGISAVQRAPSRESAAQRLSTPLTAAR